MSSRRPFCSDVSRDNGEPLGATASRIDHWLLVEYRGLWGPDALRASGLSDQVKQRLREQVHARPRSRLLFLRRPDRRGRAELRAYAATSREGEESLRCMSFSSYEDLRTLDLTEAGEPLERPEHPPPRVLAVDVAHDQLRDHRVVERRDLRALDDTGVHAHAGPRRFAVTRDPSRRREEASRDILRVDPALDRVTTKHDVLLAHGEPLTKGDQDLLADEVETRHLFGDRVLDLDPRVHLHEVVGTVRCEQSLDRSG